MTPIFGTPAKFLAQNERERELKIKKIFLLISCLSLKMFFIKKILEFQPIASDL